MANYKMIYFNARGRAEPTRLILAFLKIDYEDYRFAEGEWPKLKQTLPWGQCPVLEVDGVKISQSKAMARYIARVHGIAGDTHLEQAKCDEYVDALEDIRLESQKRNRESDARKKGELMKSLNEEVIPRYFNNFDSIIKSNPHGVLVGKKITYADIFLAFSVDQLRNLGSPGISFSKFPNVEKLTEKVLTEPSIKSWIDKRPKTEF